MLQHWGYVAASKDIAGQDQHRKPVNRGRGGSRKHVGGPGPDRGGAGKDAQPVIHLGKSRRRVHHGLFIASQVVAKIEILMKGFTHAGHVTVTEDTPDAGEERSLASVTLDVLLLEKSNECLSHRQSLCFHGCLLKCKPQYTN